MKKLIIFDWGGIIDAYSENGYTWIEAFKDLFNHFGIDLDKDNMDLLYSCNIFNGIHIQSANEEEFVGWFDKLKEVFNLNCTYNEFCYLYDKYFSNIDFYQDVVDYVHSLIDEGNCKVGILSNLDVLDKKRLDSQVNLSLFDYIWLSCDMGTRKPNPDIYEKVMSDCGLSGDNILFIDDYIVNTEAAKKHRWNVLNTNGSNLDLIKEEISKFLL